MTVVVVSINRDLLDLDFDEDADAAERFAGALNAIVQEWMPWAQPMLGVFAAPGPGEEA